MKKKIIIIIILILIISIPIYLYATRNLISGLYKKCWDVYVPNPKKIEMPIYHDSRDPIILEIMYYDKKEIEELLKQDYVKKIEKEEVEKIYKLYVIPYFLNYLEEKEQEIFAETIDKEKLFTEENYYALLEKGPDNFLTFEFLIIDTKNNIMYAIKSFN